MNKPKLNVTLSTDQKIKLEKMSGDLNISQTNLINLAVASMLANYDEKGSFIFVDLISQKRDKKP